MIYKTTIEKQYPPIEWTTQAIIPKPRGVKWIDAAEHAKALESIIKGQNEQLGNISNWSVKKAEENRKE